MRGYAAALMVILTLCLSFSPARATENAFGRYVPGVFAGPASEIVPPVPGFYWQSSMFYYRASASKSLNIPLGRSLKSNVKAEFFNFSISTMWVPDWHPAKGVTVGLGLTLPLQTLYTKANVGQVSKSDRSAGLLGDIMLLPSVGWHMGPHFVSMNVGIYMPTGPYDQNELSNIGLNCWTFTPSIAYTYINPELHIDYSFAGGIDINTKNPATNYRSGAMAHADTTLLRTFDNGLGIGVFGSMQYQISDDKGALAEQLNGFRGRSFAIGPMVKYSTSGKYQLTLTFNWAPEFYVKNRLQGDAFYLNAMLRF